MDIRVDALNEGRNVNPGDTQVDPGPTLIRPSPPMSPSSTTPAMPLLLDTLRGVSRWVRRSRAPPSRSGLLTVNMNDSPARIDPEEAAIGRPTQTARRLVEASVSPNTRRAYAGALRRLDAWLDGRPLHDVTLTAYLAELHDAGRASSSASMAVAAACFRAKFAGQPTPAGERTARVLAGYRRTAGGERGRRQARPFGAADLAAVLATCHRPRRRGRGVESDQVALERGRLDAVIAGLLFMAGMRRSEVSALRWADVADSTDGDGMLVTVRRRRARRPHAARRYESGAGRPRGAVVGADGGIAVHGRGAGSRCREADDCPLGPGRLGVGTDESRRIDHRRDAGRELEDFTDGGALLRWRDRRTWCRCTLPVSAARFLHPFRRAITELGRHSTH